MDINEILSSLVQVTPELSSAYCIINGQPMKLAEVDNMGYEGFWLRSKLNMPAKLYRYYPNLSKEIDGHEINYSLQALVNNTVFLQSPNEFDDVYDSDIHIEFSEYEIARLREYCNRCQIETGDASTPQDLGNLLIPRLIDAYRDNYSFEGAFRKESDSELEKLSNKNFCLQLQAEIIKESDVGKALANVIRSEYDGFCLQLKTSFRTSCFTTTPYSQLMWGGAYANCHRGFCIEYTVLPNEKAYQEIYQNLFPVIYCKARPNMTDRLVKYQGRAPSTENLWDIYFHGALRKSIDWAFQNEWRLLLPMGNAKKKDYNVTFFPITKVFLGNRMDYESRKEIINICKEKEIPYVGVMRHSSQFEMRECEVLCEDCLKFGEKEPQHLTANQMQEENK